MKYEKLLNPAFLLKNRNRILPYLSRQRDGLVFPWTLLPFKNRHRGERCFIIGNGPSLRIEDLDRLKGETTFAANKIYLAFPQTEWRPSYYVVEDDLLIQQHYEEMRRLNGTVKFINNRWRALFRGDNNAVKYPRRFLDREDFPRFSDNALRGVYCGYMVTYISLQLAYFMGFSRVYLLGVDFHYTKIDGESRTFKHAPDQNKDHFVSNYFAPGEMRATPQLDLAERAMRCAKDFYEAHDRKIWNATRGGRLEVFERISLDEILSR